MKNVLITGADGYIGKELLLFLLKNETETNIFCLSKFTQEHNNKIKRFNCRFEEIKNIIHNLTDIDCVIHLACSNSNKFNQVNYLNEINNNKIFLKSINKLNIKKFIYLSTAKINDENIKKKFNKSEIYESTKLEIEKLLTKNFLNKSTKLFILRSAIVFNENNIIENNITKFVKYINNKNPIPITSKKIHKPLISISSLINYISLIKNSIDKDSKIYYLYDHNSTLEELINLIENCNESKNFKIYIPYFLIKLFKYLKINNLIFKSLFDDFCIKDNSFFNDFKIPYQKNNNYRKLNNFIMNIK